MTVVIFLVNNTPSMLQQSMLNGVRLSYIDLAKRMVESFLKLRETQEDRMQVRYMLLTYDTPPNHVKAGWQEGWEQFDRALKNLQCTGSVSERFALGNAFELIDQERMTVGIDTYGWGRCPSNSMYSFIILITNYRHGPTAIGSSLMLPRSVLTESPLTKEPFRWDQRLFALILGSSRCTPFLLQVCRKTGGWCTSVKHKPSLTYGMAKLMDSLKLELMVNFVHESQKRAENGELYAIELQTTKCAITCCSTTSKGLWPFPESYWPREDQTQLAPRAAHPEVRILSMCFNEPVWPVNVPIDKYEVRECKQPTTGLSVTECGKVWPVEIVPSSKDQREHPFGYLKKESGKIFLYLLPYDYSELNRLLTENCSNLTVKNKHFLYTMKRYINSIPRYYCFHLRKALTGVLEESVLQTVLPPESIAFLNESICNQLGPLHAAAKQRRKNLCIHVWRNQQLASTAVPQQPETVERLHLQTLLQEEKDEFRAHFRRPVVLPTITVRSTPDYRNPYTIERNELLDTFSRMRNAFYYPDTMPALQRNTFSAQNLSSAPQNNAPMLRTIMSSEELVAEVAQYRREHPEKRSTTRRKSNTVQKKAVTIKKFCLSDI
ncbi:integrator complex subunit 6-like [Anopheles stephensi]|uniref:integrator complex subunit 6-like n=1 Tax=Anopheles stephensi TaxID=30069 RepID=UPI001658AC7D|nr:integrator complex subunit 6-like [Anopheles stephensi]